MSTLYITLIEISITFLRQMHSCDLVQHEMALELQFVTSLRPTGHFLVFFNSLLSQLVPPSKPFILHYVAVTVREPL